MNVWKEVTCDEVSLVKQLNDLELEDYKPWKVIPASLYDPQSAVPGSRPGYRVLAYKKKT